jgi:hypothetical protein
MTIIRSSMIRCAITLAVVLGLALPAVERSNDASMEGVRPIAGDRETSAGPAALSDDCDVDDKCTIQNVDEPATSALKQICAGSCCDRCGGTWLRLGNLPAETANQSRKGCNGPTASPSRAAGRQVRVLKIHGGFTLCWGGRLAKQRLNAADDDKASDDPTDDDDAYQDLTAHDDSNAPNLVCLPMAVPYLSDPEFAPAIRVAHPFSPLATLERLRC